MLKKRKLFFEKLKKLGILLVTERREPKKRNVKMQKLNTTDYKVMEKIMKNSKISRTDLAKYLELTPAAISKIIKKLLSYNLIIEKNTLFSTGGRPRVTLAINSNYKKIIGVNLGAGFINIVESNLNGEIIGITERKFAFKGQEKVLELLDEELTKALSKYDKESVIGIGLATHGVVDRKKGTVIVSPHFKWKKLELRKELEKLIVDVGLKVEFLDRYAHELSGGQLQRVCIARAISTKPKFIMLDEAVSSLDISTQVEILNLLQELKKSYSLSYIFVTHDLLTLTYICDSVIFFKDGKIEEEISNIENLKNIKKDYSRKLLNAVIEF